MCILIVKFSFAVSLGCYTTVMLLKDFLFVGEFDVNRLYKEMF